MPSHAVASLWARQASWIELRFKSPLGPWSERASSSRAATQPKSTWHDFCHDFSQLCRRDRFSLRLGDSPWRGARTTRLVMTSGQPRVRSSNEKNNVAARTQSSFDRTIVTPQAPRGRRCSAGRWEGIMKTRFIGFRGGSP